MPKRKEIADVKPVTFEQFSISDDGEMLIFEVHDKSGNVGHIGINWLHLSVMVQLIGRAAEKASEARHSMGKSDFFEGPSSITAQIVSGFQVSEFPEEKLKLLSLVSPTGFRCDFAIPTGMLDQRKRPLHLAIAEELVLDETETRQRPN